jgi:hypothetical protein
LKGRHPPLPKELVSFLARARSTPHKQQSIREGCSGSGYYNGIGLPSAAVVKSKDCSEVGIPRRCCPIRGRAHTVPRVGVGDPVRICCLCVVCHSTPSIVDDLHYDDSRVCRNRVSLVHILRCAAIVIGINNGDVHLPAGSIIGHRLVEVMDLVFPPIMAKEILWIIVACRSW